MKTKLIRITMASAFVLGLALVGSMIGSNGNLSVSGQSMMKKTEDAVVGTSKKVYNTTKKGVKKGYRVGHQVGDKVWTGTKWVGRNAWKGGTWVATKTVKGTKWTYRKAKRAVVGPPKRVA